MADASNTDPYAGNVLTEQLSPILSRSEALGKLRSVPSIPRDVSSVPRHVRLHLLMSLRDLHLPSLEGVRVLESTDLMIRQGYRYRNPVAAETWSVVGNDPSTPPRPRAPATAAVVIGHSGTGKTVAIQKAFGCLGRQVIQHAKFPRLVGPHFQMVHLSVDVPPSGRQVDLASNLMIAWDNAVAQALPDRARRFEYSLAKDRRDGAKMMDEWRQVAVGHFLGCLHLDEVQNFFKLPTLERRRSSGRRGGTEAPPELSIIEDQALKSVLTLSNTWQIPLLVSGTPDGFSALSKRLSNLQRFVTSGFHKMPEFTSATDPFFIEFMKTLGQFQYVATRLAVDDDLRSLVYSLSGGVQRLVVALWIAAHRIAFERKEDSLRLEDFKKAGHVYFAAVAPAIAALTSKDPDRMRRYEDLLPRDDGYWISFLSGVTTR